MKAKTADKQADTSQKYLSSKLERISYGLYFVGQNIFYILLLSFLNAFFYDIGIPAATVAVLVLVVKAWDAINDPIFGGIVDKVKFKKGKFVPWLRISLVMIPLATVLIFAIPSSLSIPAKVAWAAIAYMLWDTAYTVCDVPIFGLVTTMTDNQQERTVLMTISRMAATAAAIFVMVLVPGVRAAIGGWLPMAVVLSVLGLLFMLPICFTAKERIEPKEAEQEVGLRQMFRYLGKNKYLMIYFGALVIMRSADVASTMNLIFARHALGDESLMMILSLLTVLPMFAVGAFVPALTKRFDKFYLYIGAVAATAVMGVISFFVGYHNITLFIGLSVLRGLPLGFTTMLMFMFTPDCVEYGTYHSGISAPGITFSIQTFSVKLTAAISASLGSLALAAIGYVEGEISLGVFAQQAAGFEDKLFAVYMLIPVVGALLCLPLLWRYKLRDKDVQIMAKCNAGEISKEEADQLLGGRYK